MKQIAKIDHQYPLLSRSSKGTEKSLIVEWLCISAMNQMELTPDQDVVVRVTREAMHRWGLIVDEGSRLRDMCAAIDELSMLKLAIGPLTDKRGRIMIPFTEFVWKGDDLDITIQAKCAPYFAELRKNFTQIDMDILIRNLDGLWARRLYIILRNQLFSKNDVFCWNVKVEDLKLQLGVGEGHKRWDNFKKHVLQPAVDDINENSDLGITYTTTRWKEGIVAIEFVICATEIKAPKLLGFPTRPAYDLPEEVTSWATLIGFTDMEYLQTLLIACSSHKILSMACDIFSERFKLVQPTLKAAQVRKALPGIIQEVEKSRQKSKVKSKIEIARVNITSEEIDAYLLVHRESIEAELPDDIRGATAEAREIAVRYAARERLRSERATPGN